MDDFIRTFETVRSVLRGAILGLAILTALVALVSWAVRARRVSPFGPLGRFSRSRLDPLLRPVERHVVSRGGQPRDAPWWALVFVVVGGLIVMFAFDIIGGMIARAATAFTSSPGAVFVLILGWAFGLLKLALIVRVISSWFRVSPYSPYIRWTFVLTEWMLAPLRRIIPTIGPIDVTPLVAFFSLEIIQAIISRSLS